MGWVNVEVPFSHEMPIFGTTSLILELHPNGLEIMLRCHFRTRCPPFRHYRLNVGVAPRRAKDNASVTELNLSVSFTRNGGHDSTLTRAF